MNILRNILTITILTFANIVSGQTFDRIYQGWWATTKWTFEFNSNGTYKRISEGHYGFTTVTGNYKINGDTIQILTGFENTHGTVNEKYLIDNDSVIIDLKLLYEYKLGMRDSFVSSPKRYDILKKPNMDSLIIVTKQEFDLIIESCISILTTHRYPIHITEKESHIAIIRAINTITFNFNRDSSFKSGIYTDFMKLIKDKDYEKEMATYYDWIESRGLGFYFQELQIELGGTPHLYSLYTIE